MCMKAIMSPSSSRSNLTVTGAMPATYNLTPRFALLRSVCCLSLASFIISLVILTNTNIVKTSIHVAVSLFILLHHIAIAFGPRLSLPGLVDLIITAGEIGVLVWITSVTSRGVNGWSSPTTIVNATTWWMFLIFVVLFATLKVFNTIAVKGRNLLVRVDITDVRWMRYVPRKDTDDVFETIGRSDKVAGGNVLFGRSPWQAKLVGEQKWMIFARGAVAALFIFIMVVFAMFTIVFVPLRESALLPTTNLRTRKLPADIKASPAVWNVVLRRLSSNKTDLALLSGAVQAIRLSDSDSGTEDAASCTKSNPWTESLASAYAHTITLYCYPKQYLYKELPLRVTHPDLLITVNFTQLKVSTSSIANVAENSVQVLLGFLNDTITIIDNTVPVTIIPGANIFAMTNMVIRQQLQSPSLATFGLFDSYHTYYISEANLLIQDPSSSPLITRSPDIATIRITLQVNSAQWRINQDSRDKSVLRGLSTVGGLWTAIGGFFVVVFGTSILRVMFNIKPVSVLGLAHSVQKEEIRDSCLKRYPRIPHDMQMLPEDRGLVSLLSEHLIDLDFLQSKSTTTMQIVPDAIPLTGPLSHDDEDEV